MGQQETARAGATVVRTIEDEFSQGTLAGLGQTEQEHELLPLIHLAERVEQATILHPVVLLHLAVPLLRLEDDVVRRRLDSVEPTLNRMRLALRAQIFGRDRLHLVLHDDVAVVVLEPIEADLLAGVEVDIEVVGTGDVLERSRLAVRHEHVEHAVVIAEVAAILEAPDAPSTEDVLELVVEAVLEILGHATIVRSRLAPDVQVAANGSLPVDSRNEQNSNEHSQCSTLAPKFLAACCATDCNSHS
jgi:hypothetical protein